MIKIKVFGFIHSISPIYTRFELMILRCMLVCVHTHLTCLQQIRVLIAIYYFKFTYVLLINIASIKKWFMFVWLTRLFKSSNHFLMDILLLCRLPFSLFFPLYNRMLFVKYAYGCLDTRPKYESFLISTNVNFYYFCSWPLPSSLSIIFIIWKKICFFNKYQSQLID